MQIPCTQGEDSHSFRLCWHRCPENPFGHSQANWVTFPRQVAPFWHGLEAQGSASSSQVFPVYPGTLSRCKRAQNALINTHRKGKGIGKCDPRAPGWCPCKCRCSYTAFRSTRPALRNESLCSPGNTGIRTVPKKKLNNEFRKRIWRLVSVLTIDALE